VNATEILKALGDMLGVGDPEKTIVDDGEKIVGDVESEGDKLLTTAQRGFQEAAKAAVAQAPAATSDPVPVAAPPSPSPAPAESEPATKTHAVGSIVSVAGGGHAVVLAVVTEVQDNEPTADGGYKPSLNVVALPKPRYVLGTFAQELGPLELD
jgi:hypothetical protein